MSVVLDGVSKRFYHKRDRRWVTAIDNVSLTLNEGEFVCVIGPSGCGKSTLLNLVAGFEKASDGRVELDGAPIREPGPDRGVVFQEHGLFPWLTVAGNVTYGPKVRRSRVGDDRVDEVLSLVGMLPFKTSYPHELSGGMRQRVALARVLVNEPRILLMDEPFGALDALTRLKMQSLILSVFHQRPTGVLFVTHDIEEAILLADRIVVMSAHPGRITREFVVDQPRPRLIEEPDIAALKHEITSILLDD